MAKFIARIIDAESAWKFLNGNDRKKLGHNTYVTRRGITSTLMSSENNPGIIYHDTIIVSYTERGGVILNSGGWHTMTTSQRMHELTPPWILVGLSKGQLRVSLWADALTGKRVWKDLQEGKEYRQGEA